MKIVSGSRPQQGEYREVVFGVAGGKHIQIVSEIIAVSVWIPSNIAVRLRVTSGTVTIVNPVFKAAAQPLFALLGCCADRGAVTGQGEALQVNQAFLRRGAQKQFAEDLKEQRTGICFIRGSFLKLCQKIFNPDFVCRWSLFPPFLSGFFGDFFGGWTGSRMSGLSDFHSRWKKS